MKRILIPGANAGLGLATSKRLLVEHSDTFILLGCRDAAGKGAAAVAEVIAEGKPRGADWSSRVQTLKIDVSTDESVAAAAADVIQTFGASLPPLYGVMNNAAAVSGSHVEQLNVNAIGYKRVMRSCRSSKRKAEGL